MIHLFLGYLKYLQAKYALEDDLFSGFSIKGSFIREQHHFMQSLLMDTTYDDNKMLRTLMVTKACIEHHYTGFLVSLSVDYNVRYSSASR